jgi:hypothetical protein
MNLALPLRLPLDDTDQQYTILLVVVALSAMQNMTTRKSY